ncbi:MAG: TIGR02302 family protein [Hyphomicrobiales bacterium]|nr:MAG: TIGR02302 family protein [Hyphomicrobiales bacterium]
MRPERSPRGERAANPRLERLAAKARAILLFERAWRIALPPLVVLGFFVCLSWMGLWLDVPRWARGLGVFALALGLVIALLPLGKFRLPSRKEALDRIDRVSALASHPASVIDDRLGNGTSDPATRALWNLHRRRAEQAVALLRPGGPTPRMVDLDIYALRATVVVALIATGFVAGHEKYARVAAAFDWRFDASQRKDYRIDAWIDPPAYTGKPPIVLNLGGNQNPQQIEAPSGSIVVIHAPGGNLDMEVKGALAAAKDNNADAQASLIASGSAAAKPSGGKGSETRLVLRGDATLTLGHSGAPLGAFDIHAVSDQPSSIALTAAPRFNARGSMTLKYSVADDYGVTGAEARFAKPVLPGGHPATRSLADPPRMALQLPPAPDLGGEAETTADLSEHPWAGARVEMTLIARDEGGNEGSSDPVEITLPQKPFVKPLARALAEQRRNLVLAPEDRVRAANALDALMIAPEVFGTGAGVYLGLRVAFDRLNAAHSDSDLVEVADYLWQMALRIENGDLSEAERDLRAAEQQLRDALQRNAPEDEIRKLGENLRGAMDKFLQELAAQQKNEDRQDNLAALEGRGRAIRPKELQRMLDKMQDMLRSGDSANAQKMLEQLQNILENLRIARPRKADPRAREMSRALGELGQMGEDQQDLRDETYRSGQSERHRQREERGQLGLPGQPTLGDIFGQDGDAIEGGLDRQGNGQDAGGKSGKSPRAGQTNDADLVRRQKALRDRLENLQKRLDEDGAGANGLDGAQNAMRDAENALGQGPSGSDGAVDAQGRAVEALREGAQKLAESMRGEAGGSGEEAGEGQDGQGSPGQFGDAEGTDPLGRSAERLRGFDPSARFPGAERARRVLEELRRRLGEPARPREEMDYLERLLRRY